MADDLRTTQRQALAMRLRSRIPALLRAWRVELAADPKLKSGDALPRSQLEDHLPQWLERLARRLAAPPGDAAQLEIPEAEAHGLQRWQQGYDLHEVTREWACLHRCLVDELEVIAADGSFDAAVLAEARHTLARQIGEATTQSAEEYFRLDRMEAAGSLLDLQHAMETVRELERRQAELWQQAAHDLRGGLGVVANVTRGLHFPDLPAERRQDFLALLRNNVGSLHRLLDQVTDLARLQAGQEQRQLASFDAAATLRQLCAEVRPLAEEKGLVVSAQGPEVLKVHGDEVKVRRVAQNLILNALKYTGDGGVTVTWSDASLSDDARWSFVVQDTGPGFHAGPGAPVVNALSHATSQAGEVADDSARKTGAPPADSEGDPRPLRQVQGEGLGLAIVRRLCDLLDASVEVNTVPHVGTTFRVLIPLRYDGATSGGDV